MIFRRRTQEIRNEITSLYAEIDLHKLLNRIAETIRKHLHCEEASIFIYNPQKEELSFEIATGEKGDSLKKITLNKGEGIAGWIIAHNQPLIINDCATDPRFAAQIDRQVQFRTRSILGMPVSMGETQLGVLEAINKQKGVFTPRDRALLFTIARLVAIPLQNAILFKSILQESREKEQLIRLGKKISSSFAFNDMFSTFSHLIRDMIPAATIKVFVKSQGLIYDLLSGSAHPYPEHGQTIPYHPGQRLRVPLDTLDRSVGFLELTGSHSIPDASVPLLQGCASFLAIAIEKQEMYRQSIEREKLARELEIARTIQQSFLQAQGLIINGLEIDYRLISSSAVGGDYYEVMELPDRKILVSMNDVSGHGIPASLVMSIFRANFIYHIRENPDLSGLLSHLNNILAETTDSSLYVTSFTGLIDRAAGEFTYINAGHPAALLIRDGSASELASNSMVIGIMAGVEFSKDTVAIHPGDLLVLFTDGLVEAENDREEMFGPTRLAEFICAQGDAPASDLTQRILDELRRFTGKEAFADDVTLMLVRVSD